MSDEEVLEKEKKTGDKRKKSKKETKKDEGEKENEDVGKSSGSDSEPVKKRKPKPKNRDSGAPKTLDMIVEAIDFYNNPNSKGCSVVAIRNYILNYHVVQEERLKFLIRNALKKGLKDGILGRPKGAKENASLLLGRYIQASVLEPAPPKGTRSRKYGGAAPPKGKKKKKKKRKTY